MGPLDNEVRGPYTKLRGGKPTAGKHRSKIQIQHFFLTCFQRVLDLERDVQSPKKKFSSSTKGRAGKGEGERERE